jgi:hypothetical protein
MNILNKVKSFGKRCWTKVKEDPLEVILLTATLGLSAYSAYTTVKRGDELQLIGDDSEAIPEETTTEEDNSDENG